MSELKKQLAAVKEHAEKTAKELAQVKKAEEGTASRLGKLEKEFGKFEKESKGSVAKLEKALSQQAATLQQVQQQQ